MKFKTCLLLLLCAVLPIAVRGKKITPTKGGKCRSFLPWCKNGKYVTIPPSFPNSYMDGIDRVVVGRAR